MTMFETFIAVAGSLNLSSPPAGKIIEQALVNTTAISIAALIGRAMMTVPSFGRWIASFARRMALRMAGEGAQIVRHLRRVIGMRDSNLKEAKQ